MLLPETLNQPLPDTLPPRTLCTCWSGKQAKLSFELQSGAEAEVTLVNGGTVHSESVVKVNDKREVEVQLLDETTRDKLMDRKLADELWYRLFIIHTQLLLQHVYLCDDVISGCHGFHVSPRRRREPMIIYRTVRTVGNGSYVTEGKNLLCRMKCSLFCVIYLLIY